MVRVVEYYSLKDTIKDLNFENYRLSRKKFRLPKNMAAENRRQIEQGVRFLGCHTCEICLSMRRS